jgi:hypothetical protein
MGKHSLPKVDEEDFLPVPKNKYTSMRVHKDVKSRRVAGGKPSSSPLTARRPRALNQPQRPLSRRQQRKPALHPSHTARVHAKTARRKDLAADDNCISHYDDVDVCPCCDRAECWRDCEDDEDDEDDYSPSFFHLRFRSASPRAGRWNHAVLHGEDDDGAGDDGVDMDEVLECGLTRRQVRELQFREITPEDFEVLLELDEKVAKKALGKEQADSLFTRAVFATGDEPVDCGVCLCEVEVDDVMIRLPCNHAFHDVCITKWLTEYNTTCPFKCDLTKSSSSSAAAGHADHHADHADHTTVPVASAAVVATAATVVETGEEAAAVAAIARSVAEVLQVAAPQPAVAVGREFAAAAAAAQTAAAAALAEAAAAMARADAARAAGRSAADDMTAARAALAEAQAMMAAEAAAFDDAAAAAAEAADAAAAAALRDDEEEAEREAAEREDTEADWPRPQRWTLVLLSLGGGRFEFRAQ